MRKKTNEISGIRIETRKYFASDTQRLVNKMNKLINEYKLAYGENPQFIVISREIEVLLNVQLCLMSQKIGIMAGDKPLEFYSVFGVPCIVSKALTGLQFEVR